MHFPKFLSLISLLAAILVLQGCEGQSSPDEVAKDFWDAVVSNDTANISQHVAKKTLEDPGLLSNKDKTLTAVEIGTVTTHESSAEVETVLIGNSDGKDVRLPVTTYLVLEDDAWKVHGQQSVNALVSASMNLMMNDLTGNISGLGQALSDSLSGGFQEFINAFNKEAPKIQKELEKLADEEKTRDIGQKLGKLFSEGLSDVMGELSKGLDELSTGLDNATRETPENQSGN